jgi:hypothetical protein
MGGGGEGAAGFGGFIPIILMFVIFYFLLIRPQQKKQKDHRRRNSRQSPGKSCPHQCVGYGSDGFPAATGKKIARKNPQSVQFEFDL